MFLHNSVHKFRSKRGIGGHKSKISVDVKYGSSLWSFPPRTERPPLRVLLERLQRAGHVLVVDVHEVEDLLDFLLGIGDDVLEEDGMLVNVLVPLIIGELKKKIIGKAPNEEIGMSLKDRKICFLQCDRAVLFR